MSVDLAGLFDDIAGIDATVIGDAVLDVFVDGVTQGLCREAPAPVVAVRGSTDAPGGAGNAAANVAALGGRPRLVTAIGRDMAGQRLRAALAACGVQADHASTMDAATVVKRRVMASGHVLIRLDEGTGLGEEPGTRAAIDHALALASAESGLLIVSDYGYGVLGPQGDPALQAARDRVGVVVVDAKRPGRYSCLAPTATTPNYADAMRMLDRPVLEHDSDRLSQLHELSEDLLAATGARMVVVTLGRSGSILLERDRPPYRATVAEPAPHDVIGAGDAFTAAFGLALSTGAAGPAAAEFATLAAASASVSSAGRTARCVRHVLAARLRAGNKALGASELSAWAAAERQAGSRIVFTNGCFDLLHEGHVAFLSQAKALGDKLIVAVNDDDSVRRLKGDGRPVIDLAGRMRMLMALSCVDHVVPFAGASPIELIEAVLPDLYVKGGDYTAALLPELAVLQRHGVRVRFLDYLQDRSTSRIIETVRSQR